MGYEYNNLLRRYGLSTPQLAYTGAQKPVDSAAGYDDLMNKYNADHQTYTDWLAEYQNRVNAFDPYGGGYKGEVLGAPTYKYGYAPIAPAKPIEVVNPEDVTKGNVASQPVERGGDQSGPSGGRSVNDGFYGLQNGINTPMGAGIAYGLSRLGALGAMSQDPTNVPVETAVAIPVSEIANGDRGQGFSGLDQATRDSITNAADPIGALSDALGMGGPSDNDYGGSDHDQSGDGPSGGSREGDSSHGDGFAMGGLVRKYAGGGMVDRGLDISRVSPQQLQMMLSEDPEALRNGIAHFQQTAQDPVDHMTTMLERLNAPTPQSQEVARQQAAYNKQMEDFNSMVEKLASSNHQEAPSQAEMYFKLAAAFGAPTKTGSFGENLAGAAGVMGEHTAETRKANSVNRAASQQLALDAQKMRLQGSRDLLTNATSLAEKDQSDRKALLLEQMKLRGPQSTLGKAAMDSGLTPGTPEFNKFITDNTEASLMAKIAPIQVAQDTLRVRQDAEARAAENDQRRIEAAKKLTPMELKLKTETQDLIDTTAGVLGTLQEAYKLNPDTFDTSLMDKAQYKLLSASGSSDPKVVNTDKLNNLLKGQALASLKASFGGNPTEGERGILMEIQGIDAKNKETRAAIIKKAYATMLAKHKQQKARLADINSGKYRSTEASEAVNPPDTLGE